MDSESGTRQGLALADGADEGIGGDATGVVGGDDHEFVGPAGLGASGRRMAVNDATARSVVIDPLDFSI